MDTTRKITEIHVSRDSVIQDLERQACETMEHRISYSDRTKAVAQTVLHHQERVDGQLCDVTITVKVEVKPAKEEE